MTGPTDIGKNQIGICLPIAHHVRTDKLCWRIAGLSGAGLQGSNHLHHEVPVPLSYDTIILGLIYYRGIEGGCDHQQVTSFAIQAVASHLGVGLLFGRPNDISFPHAKVHAE